jgi:predicted nucleic acid-binding protein
VAVIILDTDTLIDYSKGYAPWIDEMMQKGSIRLVLPTIVIAEFFASKTLDDLYEVEVAERTFALFDRQDLTEGIAKTMGQLLRRKAYPSGASIPDIIIAATAVHLQAPVATRNAAHFRGIPGLTFFSQQQK